MQPLDSLLMYIQIYALYKYNYCNNPKNVRGVHFMVPGVEHGYNSCIPNMEICYKLQTNYFKIAQ